MGAGAVSARAVWEEELGKVELEIDAKETEVERGGMDRLVYREDAAIN
jgi:hypothetical protein